MGKSLFFVFQIPHLFENSLSSGRVRSAGMRQNDNSIVRGSTQSHMEPKRSHRSEICQRFGSQFNARANPQLGGHAVELFEQRQIDVVQARKCLLFVIRLPGFNDIILSAVSQDVYLYSEHIKSLLISIGAKRPIVLIIDGIDQVRGR